MNKIIAGIIAVITFLAIYGYICFDYGQSGEQNKSQEKELITNTKTSEKKDEIITKTKNIITRKNDRATLPINDKLEFLRSIAIKSPADNRE